MSSATSASTTHSRSAMVLFFLLCLSLIPFSPGGSIGTAGAAVTASPSAINFGTVRVGGEYSRGITFSNDDTANPATVTLNGGSGIFSIDGQTRVIIPAGGSTTSRIIFKPTQERDYSAKLSAAGLGVSVRGKGYYGIIDVIDVRESPNLAFGPCPIGERKTAVLHFVNTGGKSVTVLKIIPDLSGSDANKVFTFTSINSIPAYGIKDVTVTFAPKEVRSYSVKVQFLYDNYVKTSEISLSGSGVNSASGIISVASRLDFGNVSLGRSKTASLMFFNNSGYDVNISSVDLPEGAFTSPNSGKIPAYGVLELQVTFTPKSAQTFTETMRVLYEGGWLPESEISLQGTGTADPELEVAPGVFTFGTVGVGQEKSQTLVLTNTGDVAINIFAAQTSADNFKVAGLAGVIKAGETKVGTVTFAPVAKGPANGTLELVLDNLPSKKIPLSGIGAEIVIDPVELNFAGLTVGESSSKGILITNCSDHDLQVKGAVTGTSSFQINGIAAGDIIPAHGGSIECQVTFHPETSGYFADNVSLNIGPVQEASIPKDEVNMGTRYYIHLTGVPYVNFTPTEFDTFTANSSYRLWISAASPQSGRRHLYVLLSHDPLSSGIIYALTANGSLQHFPYQSTDGWQNLWYRPATTPDNVLDLSQIDLRQLGCGLCQGPEGDSGEEFHFGNIVIKPPVKNDNNASDFRYMGGTLYMGTFVKDPAASLGQPFVFNEGLLEFQILHIRSLAGVWRVTSNYLGADQVHRNLLSVQEQDGRISATWSPYPAVKASYADAEAAYILDFTYGGYHYVYRINQLTAYSFKGTYSCYYRDQTVEKNAPVSGERVR